MKGIHSIWIALLLPLTLMAQQQPLSLNTYKHYTGTLAGKRISASFWSINGDREGSYEYDKYRAPVMLQALSSQKQHNKIRFGENVDPAQSGQRYPVWVIQFLKDSITGKWYSADQSKSYTIRLKEDYPEGVTHITYVYAHKEIPAFPQENKSDSFGITYIYPKVLGNGEKAQFLNGEIKNLLGFKSDVTFAKGIKDQYKKHTKKYLSWVQEFKNTGDTDTYPLDWFSLTQINITYNENDFVQLHVFQQGYFGGAHSGHSEGNLIYDMKNKQLLGLNDVTTMDSVQLQRLIEAQFRKGHGLQLEDSLNTILFKNYLAPTENFSFNQQGIQFIYNPYEVGPYSMGTIHVFIPYEKLKGTLVPEFKKRIHL